LIAAHRGGGSSFGPENIMWTYRRSIEEVGVAVLEIDVMRTKDGVLVLSHDNRRWFGQISNMTFQELCKVDAAFDWSPDGGLTFPLRGKGHKTPTLNEVFETWAEKFPTLCFYLDVKSPGIVQQILDMVKKFNLLSRIILGAVGSVENDEILALKPKNIPSSSSAKQVITLLSHYMFGWLDDTLKTLEHEVVGFPLGHWGCSNLLPQGFVDCCHKHGKQVWVFGPSCDLVETQDHAWKTGVDAIFCDIPDVATKNLLLKVKKI